MRFETNRIGARLFLAACHKCCFNPCDRTSVCEEGVYYVKDKYGNIIRMIELPEPSRSAVSRAVEKALGI